MKKMVLIVGGLLSLGAGLTSCKEENVCSCDKTYITGTGASVQNYTLYPYTDTRRKAQERCKTNNTGDMDAEGTYTITCQLQ
ncbi:MAG: hypothetical protein V4580_12100 [Bacteroidota bacterium]